MDQNVFTSWRKSTRSQGGANCVEFATARDLVGLRDSKDPDGPVLTFTAEAWRLFVIGVRNGEFESPGTHD